MVTTNPVISEKVAQLVPVIAKSICKYRDILCGELGFDMDEYLRLGPEERPVYLAGIEARRQLEVEHLARMPKAGGSYTKSPREAWHSDAPKIAH
jgi:hypothetical protein